MTAAIIILTLTIGPSLFLSMRRAFSQSDKLREADRLKLEAQEQTKEEVSVRAQQEHRFEVVVRDLTAQVRNLKEQLNAAKKRRTSLASTIERLPAGDARNVVLERLEELRQTLDTRTPAGRDSQDLVSGPRSDLDSVEGAGAPEAGMS